MMPEWDPVTGNLPEGVYQAEWNEVKERFGLTPRRRRLLEGLGYALEILRSYGCRRVWVDGGFVTAKPEPGDFDCCWDYSGTRIASLQTDYPVLFDFSDQRRAQKERFGGEIFLAHHPADALGTLFLDFFQRDRYAGDRKGIILIELPPQEEAEITIERR